MSFHHVGPYQRPVPYNRKFEDAKKRKAMNITPQNFAPTPTTKNPVLVHGCFDQQGGESKPDCSCTEIESHHIGFLDAGTLIKNGKADWLRYTKNGKVLISKNSIVLRREYVQERLLKSEVDPAKLIPAIVRSTNRITYKRNRVKASDGTWTKGVIRAENGTPIELELERTDAEYWNGILVALGLGAEAGKFLKDAAVGMGEPVSFTKLENWQMAPVKPLDGLDPEINGIMAGEIHARKEGVRQRRHKVGAAGFVKGSGGVTYNEFGKTVKAKPIWSAGSSRDSDERFGEGHDTTGQMNSERDPNYAGMKGSKPENMPVGPEANPYRATSDNRTLPKPLLSPGQAQKEIDEEEAKAIGEKYAPVYTDKVVEAKRKLDESATDDIPDSPLQPLPEE
jgi:hypothetical protein